MAINAIREEEELEAPRQAIPIAPPPRREPAPESRPVTRQVTPQQAPSQPREALPADAWVPPEEGERQNQAAHQELGKSYDPKRFVSVAGAARAVDAAIKGVTKTFGLDQQNAALPGTDPRRQQGMEAYARNVGAPSQAEIQQINDTIDPRRELTDAERSVARFYAGYEFFMQRGQPDKAEKYAAHMFMHAKRAVQMSGAMAQAQVEKGNIEGAAKAVAEGYNYIPNGKSVQVESADRSGITFSIEDENGNITPQGKVGLDRFMQQVVGMQNGSAFFEAMNGMTPYQRAQINRQKAADAENQRRYERTESRQDEQDQWAREDRELQVKERETTKQVAALEGQLEDLQAELQAAPDMWTQDRIREQIREVRQQIRGAGGTVPRGTRGGSSRAASETGIPEVAVPKESAKPGPISHYDEDGERYDPEAMPWVAADQESQRLRRGVGDARYADATKDEGRTTIDPDRVGLFAEVLGDDWANYQKPENREKRANLMRIADGIYKGNEDIREERAIELAALARKSDTEIGELPDGRLSIANQPVMVDKALRDLIMGPRLKGRNRYEGATPEEGIKTLYGSGPKREANDRDIADADALIDGTAPPNRINQAVDGAIPRAIDRLKESTARSGRRPRTAEEVRRAEQEERSRARGAAPEEVPYYSREDALNSQSVQRRR